MKGRESHKERVHAAKKGEEHKEHEKRARGGAMHDGEHRGHQKMHVTKKAGGMVEGKEPKHRLDKRARGGAMTPKAPYSGAEAPNLEYAQGDLKVDAHGKGKDRD